MVTHVSYRRSSPKHLGQYIRLLSNELRDDPLMTFDTPISYFKNGGTTLFSFCLAPGLYFSPHGLPMAVPAASSLTPISKGFGTPCRCLFNSCTYFCALHGGSFSSSRFKLARVDWAWQEQVVLEFLSRCRFLYQDRRRTPSDHLTFYSCLVCSSLQRAKCRESLSAA